MVWGQFDIIRDWATISEINISLAIHSSKIERCHRKRFRSDWRVRGRPSWARSSLTVTLFNSGGQVVIAKSQPVKVVKVSSRGIPEATRLAASQVSRGASLLHVNSFRLCNRTRCAIMVIEKVSCEASLISKVRMFMEVASTMHRKSWYLPTMANMPATIFECTCKLESVTPC